MFGFLYGLVTLFGSSYEHLRRASSTKSSKDNALNNLNKGNNPCQTYFDWKGVERDLYTNQIVSVRHQYGRTLVYDNKGNLLRDVTTEEVNERVKLDKQKGRAVTEEYDWHRLSEMWMAKVGLSNNGFWDCDRHTSIYIHCDTNRKCVSSKECFEIKKNGERFVFHYIKEMKKMMFDMFHIEKRIKKDDNDLPGSIIANINDRKIRIPEFYIDLHTGEVLGIKENSSFEIEIVDELGNVSMRKLTENEEQKVIEEFNSRIRNGNISRYLTGWERLFN